jgi:hypothetical protein
MGSFLAAFCLLEMCCDCVCWASRICLAFLSCFNSRILQVFTSGPLSIDRYDCCLDSTKTGHGSFPSRSYLWYFEVFDFEVCQIRDGSSIGFDSIMNYYGHCRLESRNSAYGTAEDMRKLTNVLCDIALMLWRSGSCLRKTTVDDAVQ